MRGIFGLTGLLIGVALLVWVFSKSGLETAKRGKEAQKEAAQIAGRDLDTGMTAGESYAAQAQFKGGTIDSLLVTNVVPDGPMFKYYGLSSGDAITAVNGMAIGALANDEELAKALVTEAYGRKQTLTVRRGSNATLTLPAPPGAPAVAADPANPSNSAPAPTPAPAPQKSRGIYGQVEDIQNAAGGSDAKQE